MKTTKFKTSVNCKGCLAKVTTSLDSLVGKGKWDVDLSNENKILSIETDEIEPNKVIETLNNLGFKAEIQN